MIKAKGSMQLTITSAQWKAIAIAGLIFGLTVLKILFGINLGVAGV